MRAAGSTSSASRLITDWFCVLCRSTTGEPAVTVTVSSIWPTLRLPFTVAANDPSSTIPSRL
ncbi:MAG: hypothetical protein DMF93_14075 [Acidobacteria bacterium]|nr:MAG: hypothetical protein DMF93_14075 [Acidobacteriota bacterium]